LSCLKPELGRAYGDQSATGKYEHDVSIKWDMMPQK
jgi:hypothetical protein